MADDPTVKRRSIRLSASFLIAGLGAYVMMAVAKRGLPADEFSAFSVFWSFGFFLTGSIGYPLEQELSRTIAARDAVDERFDDVIRRAARLCLALVAVAATLAVTATTLDVPRGLDGSTLLVVALVVLIVGEALTSLCRGVLSGTRATDPLGALVAGQSLLRMIVVIAAVRFSDRGAVVAAVVAVPSMACLVLAARLRAPAQSDRRAPARDAASLSGGGVVRLVLAAPFNAVFAVGTPALASVVASQAEENVVGNVLAALSLTSAPVLVAAALQSALLPTLVRSLLDGTGQTVRRITRRIILVVSALAVIAAAFMLLVGPWLLRLLFGESPGVGRWALAAMTGGAGLLFLANMLAPVCVARRSHGSVTTAWVVGAGALVLMLLVPGRLGNRVALAVLVGASVVAMSMVTSLRAVWKLTGAAGAPPARVAEIAGHDSISTV